jgi:hypothetical protein
VLGRLRAKANNDGIRPMRSPSPSRRTSGGGDDQELSQGWSGRGRGAPVLAKMYSNNPGSTSGPSNRSIRLAWRRFWPPTKRPVPKIKTCLSPRVAIAARRHVFCTRLTTSKNPCSSNFERDVTVSRVSNSFHWLHELHNESVSVEKKEVRCASFRWSVGTTI